MPINLQRLNTKLGALQAKDLDALVAQQVRIPFLSSPYNKTKLQAWLDKRVTRLQQIAATATDAEVLAMRSTLYGGLSPAGQLLADQIIAKEPVVLPDTLSASDYDRLVGIILIMWVLD